MRMRDVYSSLLEMVPRLTPPGGAVVTSWSARADPIWRRGSRWVRVEAVTGSKVRVLAGDGERTAVERPLVLENDLQPVAQQIADLLGGDIEAAS